MLKKWLREPLLHFLLIGGLLFFLYGLQNEGLVDQDNRIEITEADINRLITVWEKKRQRLPTQVELRGMIEQQIREEVMYREALVMGLEHNDPIVRRRLAQKVEFISADLVAQVEPTEAELAKYLAAHSDKFELPGRINFVQIYLNTDKRGAGVQEDALQLLEQLNHTDSKVDVTTAGDPIMFGQQHEQVTMREVSRLFGKDFASKLFTLPVGNWQGPVLSGYGLHLVRVDNKTVARQPALDTIREKVRNEWFAQQRRTMDEAFYQSLRQRYEIVIRDGNVKDTVASANP